MAIYDIENSKYTALKKAFVVENGKYVPLKNAFVVEGGKYVKVWSSSLNAYVACGASGKVAHSADGITWTAYQATIDGVATTETLNSIAYGNGVFTASIGNNKLYYSNY